MRDDDALMTRYGSGSMAEYSCDCATATLLLTVDAWCSSLLSWVKGETDVQSVWLQQLIARPGHDSTAVASNQRLRGNSIWDQASMLPSQ
jgi:hypothetical protein